MVDNTLLWCYSIRVGQEEHVMNIDELKTLWRFWTVGGVWQGCRATGQMVRAGTYSAVLKQAEWFEQSTW